MNKEEFIKYTDEIKEVINAMPRNNKKNKKLYLEYLSEQKGIFCEKKDQIIKEIKRRYDKIVSLEKDCGIRFDDKREQISDLANKMFVFLKWNTPYEKIELDRIIFEINHYYKDNLNALNDDIRDAVSCFRKVGVSLFARDFSYSSYTYQYMSVILEKEDDVEAIKKRLDDVYWKSPKVMNQIACNFQYLYYKYEKKFISYYENLKKEILGNRTYSDINCEFDEMVRYEKELSYQLWSIIPSIMDGSINIKDYSEEKLKSYEESISCGNVGINHYLELYYSLEEYKMYKEYVFIIDKFKEIYQNKAQYKNVCKNLKKEIGKLEGKLFKINKKISFQSKYFHHQDKIELMELEANSLIDNLMEKYHELQFSKVNEIISLLNDSVSYYDILSLVSSFYIYFRKLVVENQEGIGEEEVIEKRLELSQFLLRGNLYFLPNISIVEDVNISQIIADKEKLLNVSISADDIDSNVDFYMELICKIMISYSIKNGNVGYDELLFQFQAKDIVE